MEFVTVGLLVLNLVSTLVFSLVLKRENVLHFIRLAGLLNEPTEHELLFRQSLKETQEAVLRKLDELEAESRDAAGSLSGLWKESEKQAARGDVSESLKRIEGLLAGASTVLTSEQEQQLSRAMDEGIASILSYAAGKLPGVELRL